MRFNEFKLVEGRGLTARNPGETYVNRENPDHVLAVESIEILSPEGEDAFETQEDLLAAIKQKVPGKFHEDNTVKTQSRAAIIAVFKLQGAEAKETWVRYINRIPPGGIHGTWASPTTSKFLAQYAYGKAAKQESVPIKPADIITDEGARSAEDLANEVKQKVATQLAGTEHEELSRVITEAVDNALAGRVAPIESPGDYAAVLGKYAGEYLGPIAVLGGGVQKGDISKMMQAMNIDSLAGAQVMFPQSKTEELIDSYFILPNGTRLGVSSKIHKGGGAASSLSGVAKQLNPEINEKFPRGAGVIKKLGTLSAINGPLQVAKDYKIIDQNDIIALDRLDKASRNIDDLGTDRLRKMTHAQGIAVGSENDINYRVLYHAITAVVNAMMPAVNNDTQFKDAMMAALNNNNYLQLITDARASGNTLTLDYYGKFPAVYKGSPKLKNKSYFATGQKGRIGFKLA